MDAAGVCLLYDESISGIPLWINHPDDEMLNGIIFGGT